MKNLIVFESSDKWTNEDRELAKKADLHLYFFDDVMKTGATYLKENASAKPRESTKEDIMMFSYTSGTTGDPKGVKLSHKMILGTGFAVNARLGCKAFNENDCYISYLPASHSFEQSLFGLALAIGSKIGFYSGNPRDLMADLAILKPTLFPSVPRIYNRLYGEISKTFKAATGA